MLGHQANYKGCCDGSWIAVSQQGGHSNTKGIGEGIVREFVHQGAKVVFCASESEEQGKAIVQELKDCGAAGEAHFQICDVRCEQDIQNLVAVTIELYGRLDCLVNNVGIHPRNRTIDDFTAEDFRSLMDINAVSYFLASKGAVTAMTKALAIDESKYCVRVNSISPSNIWTPAWEKEASETPNPEATIQKGKDFQLMGRMGTPAEIAKAALFLATDATFCTGCDLVASGGAELGFAHKSPFTPRCDSKN
nr:PREDICTED: 17-beta-hydroxysteroid dehydrogenase 14 isoform X3 [Anolis carolinensis]|eukprot:XP_016852194.1 PREDICTED: 17-beta-hydroxysteroid dehydrogenase 14 isoform X3 [Anolis carolinensis]